MASPYALVIPRPEPTERTPLCAYARSLAAEAGLEADVEGRASRPPLPPMPFVAADAMHADNIVRIVVVLMIGVFVSNADGSLMLATHPIIASEFGDLARSSWLFAGFILASAATQTLYGQLSDIYGRKNLVLVSYLLFTGGCALVGAGETMLQVILGRAISGAGSAGMTALVSILISDLLPIRDVATWRAYVSVASAAGRSLGGPVGGWLADIVGWRWSFIGQVPFMLLATLLCLLYLPQGGPHKKYRLPPVADVQTTDDHTPSVPSVPSVPLGPVYMSAWHRFRRVDFLGSALLALTLLSILIPLEMSGSGSGSGGVGTSAGAGSSPDCGGGMEVVLKGEETLSAVTRASVVPVMPCLFAASAVLLALFIRTERRAIEPVVPLAIFRIRNADLSIVIQMCQVAAQMGASANASNTAAGAHLFPSVAGHAVGGILSGWRIKKTGRYRSLVQVAAASSSLAYVLLLARWKGHTNWLESMYIVFGGFGGGLVQSAIFVSVQAVVPAAHLTPAISLLYLSNTCASILGLACVSGAMQASLKRGLASKLLGLDLTVEERRSILQHALSDMGYIGRLTGVVHTAVVDAYVESLW